MSSPISPKLKKLKEKGFGKSIFIAFSSEKESKKIHISRSISSVWKQHYFFVGQNTSGDLLENKFVNSINEYSYAQYFVFDYFSFVLFIKNIERITVANEGIKRITVFNPISYKLNWRNKILSRFNLKKYLDILGKKLSINKNLEIWSYDILSKLHNLNAEECVIIGLSDKKYSLKLASKIHNSVFVKAENYEEGIEKLVE